jgi:hypothetical protein
VGSTRDFKKQVGTGGSGAVPLIGTLACGCDVDGREPELSKPVPKWWCCGAFQKRKTGS